MARCWGGSASTDGRRATRLASARAPECSYAIAEEEEAAAATASAAEAAAAAGAGDVAAAGLLERRETAPGSRPAAVRLASAAGVRTLEVAPELWLELALVR
jgi:sugar/nucleoside kinase (ribokinase family)